MRRPKLACCNFLPAIDELKTFALELGFGGVEWSFERDDVPRSAEQRQALGAMLARLAPLEIRYHCAFQHAEFGDVDGERAKEAMRLLRRTCRVVAELGGRVVTIHVGRGLDTTHGLSWERTLDALAHLHRFAAGLGLELCLENLAWGWTSRPELFEKLLRKGGPFATLDIGHALVSPSITSRHFDLEDFTAPHPERFLNAHIYHAEDERGHVAPETVEEIAGRLDLLLELPRCDWWVLELRERAPLIQTLGVVRGYLERRGIVPRAAGEEHSAL